MPDEVGVSRVNIRPFRRSARAFFAVYLSALADHAWTSFLGHKLALSLQISLNVHIGFLVSLLVARIGKLLLFFL